MFLDTLELGRDIGNINASVITTTLFPEDKVQKVGLISLEIDIGELPRVVGVDD